MIPASALIDDPVQCPACGQPVNVHEDWEADLTEFAGVMSCCKRTLTIGQEKAFLAAIEAERARREGGPG